MDEKLFTIADMRNAFISGEIFQKNSIDFDMGEVDEVTELDFDEWLEKHFGITL